MPSKEPDFGACWRISFMPPKAKNSSAETARLTPRLVKAVVSGEIGSPASSTTLLVMPP